MTDALVYTPVLPTLEEVYGLLVVLMGLAQLTVPVSRLDQVSDQIWNGNRRRENITHDRQQGSNQDQDGCPWTTFPNSLILEAIKGPKVQTRAVQTATSLARLNSIWRGNNIIRFRST